jgi:23S rRNA (pseudouridine1915-N3)-methyltransferase
MQYHFIFLGKTREKYIDAAIKDYANRLNRFVSVEIITLKEKYNLNDTDAVVKKAGGGLLLNRAGKNSFKVALDAGGNQYDSLGLARMVSGWRDQSITSVFFLIGGHLGLHHELIRASNVVWSLSKLTYTHEMARMIVLEQLYRAWTINAGHKYHK